MALLSSVKGSFCLSSAARAVVNQVTAGISLNAQRDVILSLNIDVALMTEGLKCSTYA